jgi:hypothetical protein
MRSCSLLDSANDALINRPTPSKDEGWSELVLDEGIETHCAYARGAKVVPSINSAKLAMLTARNTLFVDNPPMDFAQGGVTIVVTE